MQTAETETRFKIEDGIPLPPKPSGRRKYGAFTTALRELKPGQSFFAKDRTIGGCSAQACEIAKMAGDGRKFSARTVDGGVRVWRVA